MNCPSCGSPSHITDGILKHDDHFDGLLCKREGQIYEPAGKIELNLPELWDIQQKAFDYAFKGNERFIVIPTGMGKTLVGLSVANEMKVPTVVLCPTIELAKQWAGEIRSMGGECTVVSSETGKDFSNFTIITNASMLLNLDKLQTFRLIIFDEAHHIFAEEYSKIVKAAMDLKERKIVGLTASARQRGPESQLQNKLFPDKFIWTLAQRQRSEHAVDLHFKEEKIRLPDEDLLKYSNWWDTYVKAVKMLGGFREMMSAPPGGDMGGRYAYSKIKKLLSEHPQKLLKVIEIISNSHGNFVVFGDTIATVETIQKMLKKEGIESVKIHAKRTKNKRDKIEQSKSARSQMIDALKTGQVRVLLGVTAIEEGLNFPSMDNAIFISCLSGSAIKTIQRSGRTMRGKEGKTVSIYVLYAEGTKEEENLPVIRKNVGAD